MTMSCEALLLSIRPVFVERLLQGTKTVELRRVRPKVQEGQSVLLYASSPEKALVGTAVVEAVTTDTPKAIWGRLEGRTGVSHEEFFAYFAGATRAVAIQVRDVLRFKARIPLSEMRRRWPWLRPPQSFCFVTLTGVGEHSFSLSPRSSVSCASQSSV